MKNRAAVHASPQAAFSLVETALSASIVSFTLLPLVGLMAIITSNGRNLHDEASGMVFVEAISHTLQRDSQFTKQFTWHFPTCKESAVVTYPTEADSEPTTHLVGDETGLIVRPATEAEYTAGLSAAPLSEVYLIRVTLRRQAAGVAGQVGADPGIAVDISVETPVNLPQAKRKKDHFQTRIL